MNRAIVASLLVCIVAVVATAGCLEDGGDTEAKATMSMQGISNDYSRSMDRANMTMTLSLGSVDEGDTLIIKDTIDNLTYNQQNQSTSISFASTSQSAAMGQAPQLRFEGDITDEFSEGDTVAVTTHIINVTMTHNDPQTGQTITYHYETFEEGWDAENEASVPFPQSTIEHAKDTDEDTDENGDTDDTDDTENDEADKKMTMKEFSGIIRNQSVTNDTEAKYMYADLPSVEENDTVVITDTIQQVTPRSSRDVTQFTFTSEPKLSLYVEGNQSEAYAAGDDIEITFHIIEDVFQHPDQTNYTGWHVSLEAIQEIYNQTYHRYSMVMPADAITKI